MAQASMLIRADDPIYEIAMRLGGHKAENKFWIHTLTALAAHFQVDAEVEASVICLDKKVQWSEARNIWQNAGMRTMLYTMAAPLRWLRKKVKRRGQV